MKPEKIEIKTENIEEIYNGIDFGIRQFNENRQGFKHGEHRAYREGLEILKSSIIPRFLEKFGKRNLFYNLGCVPEKTGGDDLIITIDNLLDLKIFHQFYDTYAPMIGLDGKPTRPINGEKAARCYMEYQVHSAYEIIHSLALKW